MTNALAPQEPLRRARYKTDYDLFAISFSQVSQSAAECSHGIEREVLGAGWAAGGVCLVTSYSSEASFFPTLDVSCYELTTYYHSKVRAILHACDRVRLKELPRKIMIRCVPLLANQIILVFAKTAR